MFDDIEPIAQLDREFTRLELSVIIEALILFRSSGVRPDLDNIDPDALDEIDDIDDLEVPVKKMTDEDKEAINEMMMLFVAGFARIAELESAMLEEAYKQGKKALVSEISDFLKEQ
jgi:hypothetical protein